MTDPSLHSEASEEAPTTESLLEAWYVMDTLPHRDGQLFRGEVVYAMAQALDRVSRERTRLALERAAKVERQRRDKLENAGHEMLLTLKHLMGVCEMTPGNATMAKYALDQWNGALKFAALLSDGESVASEEKEW